MSKTALLHYRERLGDLLPILKRGSLAVLLVDLSSFSQVEQDYGAVAYDDVLDSVREIITGLIGSVLREEDLLTSSDIGGDAVLVFLSMRRRRGNLSVEEPGKIAARVENQINRQLAKLGSPYLRRRPAVTVGWALVVENPLVKPERLVSRLVQSAWESVNFRRLERRIESRSFMQEILLGGQVTTLYQPIVNLATSEILGLEALSRGPTNSRFQSKYHSPASMFELAEECDLVFELDRLCRRKALLNAVGLPPDLKLFLNVLPSCMFDPDFQGMSLARLLEPLQLSPDQVVLEITETYAIENYAVFGEAIRNLTQMGFRIAVDDIGAGHSGLEKIAEVKPRYLKFDMSLVRRIDGSFVRREMMRALTGFAHKMGSTIIAEGVERQQELEVLIELGIEYGQGFLLGRPAPLEELLDARTGQAEIVG